MMENLSRALRLGTLFRWNFGLRGKTLVCGRWKVVVVVVVMVVLLLRQVEPK